MKVPSRLRTPVGAALLSAVFPGLGQAAVGQTYRGFIIAIPALVTAAVVGLIFIFDRQSILNLALNQQWLTNLLLVDIAGLVYHAFAVVDAYLAAGRFAERQDRRHDQETRRPPGRSNPAAIKWMSALGVGAVLMSTVAVHGTVAQVDMDWQHALYCLTAKIPCWVTDPGPDATATDNGPDATDIAIASDQPGPLDSGQASLTPMPTYDMNSIPTFSTTTDSQNWDADGELNILLAGIGVERGTTAGELGFDSLMVVRTSITTGQAELISIPRNSYCTPLPTKEIAANYQHPGYNCPAGSFGPPFFNLANEILDQCKKWPIPEFAATCGQRGDPNRYVRAYKGLEMTVGTLLGIHIDGSIWMNPTGLSLLVDALGGVTIHVGYELYDKPCGPAGTRQQILGSKMPIPGNSVCGDSLHWGYYVPTHEAGVQQMKDQAAQSSGGLTVIPVSGTAVDVGIIIKPGTYHMNGAWALAYARTRIYDPQGDFGRSVRQQNFMTSMRKQLDPCHFASLDNVLPLIGAVQAVPQGFNTDLDITNAQNLKAWAGIAKTVLGDNIQQLPLTPQTVGEPRGQGYIGWDPADTLPKLRALVKAGWPWPSYSWPAAN